MIEPRLIYAEEWFHQTIELFELPNMRRYTYTVNGCHAPHFDKGYCSSLRALKAARFAIEKALPHGL